MFMGCENGGRVRGKGFLIIVLLGGIGGLGYRGSPSIIILLLRYNFCRSAADHYLQTTAPDAVAVPGAADGGQSTGINFITTCCGIALVNVLVPCCARQEILAVSNRSVVPLASRPLALRPRRLSNSRQTLTENG